MNLHKTLEPSKFNGYHAYSLIEYVHQYTDWFKLLQYYMSSSTMKPMYIIEKILRCVCYVMEPKSAMCKIKIKKK